MWINLSEVNQQWSVRIPSSLFLIWVADLAQETLLEQNVSVAIFKNAVGIFLEAIVEVCDVTCNKTISSYSTSEIMHILNNAH